MKRSRAVTRARAVATFPLAVAAVLFLIRAPYWPWEPQSIAALAVAEAAVFAVVGLLGCTLAPAAPFLSGTAGVLGVFVGSLLDVIADPTVQGFERNLLPIEAVFHTVAAILGFGAVAVLWKIASRFVREKIDA